MDDRSLPRPQAAMGDPLGGDPTLAGPAHGDQPTLPLGTPAAAPVAPPIRGPIYGRRPPLWRRIAAITAALVLLILISLWLDVARALGLWLLFSLFVLLWPEWPPATAAEERVQAWPFEP